MKLKNNFYYYHFYRIFISKSHFVSELLAFKFLEIYLVDFQRHIQLCNHP